MLRNYVKQQWRTKLAGIRIYPQPDETFRLAASNPPVYGGLTCELGLVSLPSNEPKILGAIFTFLGFASILVKAELPSLNP